MEIPVINVAATGRNINNMRKRAGMTVKDIQIVMGFNTPQAIYKWIRGDAVPTVDNLVILAAALNVKIDDILVVGTATA